MPEDGIIRRVSNQQIVTDKNGEQRLSTMAFQPSTGLGSGMSVDLQRDIEESGKDALEFVTSPRWIGSVRFTAQQLRNEMLKVGYNPRSGSVCLNRMTPIDKCQGAGWEWCRVVHQRRLWSQP